MQELIQRSCRAAVLLSLALVSTACAAPDAPDISPSSPDPSPESTFDQVQACNDSGSMEADVDGDGQPDRIFQVYAERLWLGVCTATGVEDRIEVAGMGEIFGAIERAASPKDLIVTGGTSVNRGFYSFAVFEDGSLALVQVGGEALVLETGVGESEASAWGCKDENEQFELIHVSVGWPAGSQGAWTRTEYGGEGAAWDVLSRTEGSTGSKPSQPEDRAKEADSKVGEPMCGMRSK